MLINRDCLDGMKGLSENSINLIYLDPPFFSQQLQTLGGREGDSFTFEDRWPSLEAYLAYMKERLLECFRILAPTGSLFLHCDASASHYLRVILDEIFGRKNFRSEIIWHYKRWSNSKKGLMNSHQTILFYSKTEDFTFHRIYTEYSPTTNLDQILQDRCRDESGKVIYKTDSEGKPLSTSEKKGVPLSDVWEIPYLKAGRGKNCGFFILIQTHREMELFPTEIPEEILILDHYQLKIREYLNQELVLT